MMQEEPLGLMLYGYSEEHAMTIRESLSDLLGGRVILMSASGREEEKVGEILEDHENGMFVEGEVCFAMLLGFTDQQIKDTLRGFPRDGGITRPIFTTLTPTNAEWTLSQLVADLREEEAYFKKMRERRSNGEDPE